MSHAILFNIVKISCCFSMKNECLTKHYYLRSCDIWYFFTRIYQESYKLRRLKRNESRFFSSGKTYRHLEATTSKDVLIFVVLKLELFFKQATHLSNALEVTNFRILERLLRLYCLRIPELITELTAMLYLIFCTYHYLPHHSWLC